GVHHGGVRTGVGGVAGQTLVEHTAQRVDVGATVDVSVGDLLRGEVIDRSNEGAAAGGPLSGDVAGESEVTQVRVVTTAAANTARDEDVGGLDVTMDEAASVCRIKGACDLGDDPHRPLEPEPSPGQQQVAQVGA